MRMPKQGSTTPRTKPSTFEPICCGKTASCSAVHLAFCRRHCCLPEVPPVPAVDRLLTLHPLPDAVLMTTETAATASRNSACCWDSARSAEHQRTATLVQRL